MLLSRKTRLVAAFDHRHIFLDPDSDPESPGPNAAAVRPAALLLGRL
ncbi:MAG: NAD-glutamate dehydrogenase domain-containing protein [Caulobacteraceae bacterium]